MSVVATPDQIAERLRDELRTVYATAERSALLHLSADDVSAHLPWNLIDP
jgi:hypothetical protein